MAAKLGSLPGTDPSRPNVTDRGVPRIAGGSVSAGKANSQPDGDIRKIVWI